MNIKIRKYSLLDETKLLICVKELRKYLTTLNPNRKKSVNNNVYQQITREFTADVNLRKGNIFIAEVDENIVGYVYGLIACQSEKDAREFVPVKIGEIADIYVNKNFQKIGIGILLMNEIEKFFKEKNCNKVVLTVLNNNSGAIKHYQKLGFMTECLEMTKII